MSKCREQFEVHCKERVIDLNSQYAIDLYFDWQAAWNAAIDRASEICQSPTFLSDWPSLYPCDPIDCAEAIERERT